MDSDMMKKLNWSQDLINAINDIKKIVDEGSIDSDSLKSLDLLNNISSTTSIDATFCSPVGRNYISLDNVD